MSKTRKSQQSLKGKYTLLNPEKYTGNPKKIVFRSMWERKFMLYCDQTEIIWDFIDPSVWSGKFADYPTDVKYIKEMLAQAGW